MEDTIAAIATATGEAGLSVIRVSGAEAPQIVDRCFQPAGKQSRSPSRADSHTVHYGHITGPQGVIDEVLVSVFRAPRTFTKEDVVEISCHGGMVPTRLVLQSVLSQGARLAHPGEFTKRAFLNGRLDLTQAEAVADVIHSKTELALRAANEQLAGKLAQQIEHLRGEMMNVLAHVEAHIDFPEEDIAPDTKASLLKKLKSGLEFIRTLLATAPEGQVLRHGVRTAIIGRPNAGKSSLLNCLLGKDRAIVSATAGTTRDTIEATANIRGIPIHFMDTAGLRQAHDQIEKEGIRRSQKSLEQADLVLHVIDASQGISPFEESILQQFESKTTLVIFNKTDLAQAAPIPDRLADTAVGISCQTGEGLDPLKDRIKATVWSGTIDADMLEVMINARHQDSLLRAGEATARTIEALETGQTLEFVALDLRIAVNAIGEVVGKTTTDDLLDRIFSEFCLGK